MPLRKENEIKTKPCQPCEGTGAITKKSARTGLDVPTACPFCDGYGFVLAKSGGSIPELK